MKGLENPEKGPKIQNEKNSKTTKKKSTSKSSKDGKKEPDIKTPQNSSSSKRKSFKPIKNKNSDSPEKDLGSETSKSESSEHPENQKKDSLKIEPEVKDEEMEITESGDSSNSKQNGHKNAENLESDNESEASRRKSLKRKVKVEKEVVENLDNKGGSSDSNEDDDDDEKGKKRRKTKVPNQVAKRLKKLKSSGKGKEICDICYQPVEEGKIQIYSGHHNYAVEEVVAIMQEEFMLFTGEEEEIADIDQRPCNRITSYSIYCKNGHLVPLDTGLIESDVLLYVSGYMKAIYNDDPSTTNGVWVKDLGPINSWFISGFDGGSEPFIEIETAFGEYYFSNSPSEEYAPVMQNLMEKMYLTKFVIEFLTDEIEPTFEDLLNQLTIYVPPPGMERFSEETLMQHASFLIEQIDDYDENAGLDDVLLMPTPCMRYLCDFNNTTVSDKKKGRQRLKARVPKKKHEHTKATTTKLVHNLVEGFFPDHIDSQAEKLPKMRHRKCGICSACNQGDCGECYACKDMKKFGGSGKGKQACLARRCPNMAIEDTQASDPEDEVNDKTTDNGKQSPTPHPRLELSKKKKKRKNISWVGEPIKKNKDRLIYAAVNVAGVLFRPGEYIFVDSMSTEVPPVAKIAYLFEEHGEPQLHAQWFVYGKDTVLGETADKYELFMVDDCMDIELSYVGAKLMVEQLKVPDDWRMLGNSDTDFKKPSKEKSFYYHLSYDETHARFEKIRSMDQMNERLEEFCRSCWTKTDQLFLRTAWSV